MTKHTKNKGLGIKTARQLMAAEKAKLTIWINENKEMLSMGSSHELAEIASKELGFEISNSSILTIRNSIFPEMVKPRRLKKEDKRDHDSIENLAKRVKAIESFLFQYKGFQF